MYRILLAVLLTIGCGCKSPTTSVHPETVGRAEDKPFNLPSQECYSAKVIEEEVREITTCETYYYVEFYSGETSIVPRRGYKVKEGREYRTIVPE